MTNLAEYAAPETLPLSEAGRIGRLLGLKTKEPLNDVSLALRIAAGLPSSSVAALARAVGESAVVGPLVSSPTLRRAKLSNKLLSREISERLYDYGRVVDTVSRTYHGDTQAIFRFLGTPHPLLRGDTPAQMAQSSSAGADAVINLLQRAEYGFAV